MPFRNLDDIYSKERNFQIKWISKWNFPQIIVRWIRLHYTREKYQHISFSPIYKLMGTYFSKYLHRKIAKGTLTMRISQENLVSVNHMGLCEYILIVRQE